MASGPSLNPAMFVICHNLVVNCVSFSFLLLKIDIWAAQLLLYIFIKHAMHISSILHSVRKSRLHKQLLSVNSDHTGSQGCICRGDGCTLTWKFFSATVKSVFGGFRDLGSWRRLELEYSKSHAILVYYLAQHRLNREN